MDETCIIQRWINKRVYLFRKFGEFRPTSGGVKVQESRMRVEDSDRVSGLWRENLSAFGGLRRGQGKQSDVRLPECPVREKERNSMGLQSLNITALMSYSTIIPIRFKPHLNISIVRDITAMSNYNFS